MRRKNSKNSLNFINKENYKIILSKNGNRLLIILENGDCLTLSEMEILNKLKWLALKREKAA